MTKEEYIIKSGANDASSLTDEQILAYYINLYGGLADLRNNDSANIIKEGRAFGLDIDRPKAMDMLRQAFEQDKKLDITFTIGEGIESTRGFGAPQVIMEFE